MEIELYNIEELVSVPLGRQCESGVTQIKIDIGGWASALSGATAAIVALRPGETELYTPSNVSLSNGVVTWTVNEIDTAIGGEGLAELRLSKDGAVKKSKRFTTIINGSFTGSGGPAAPTAPDWAVMIERAAVEVEDFAAGVMLAGTDVTCAPTQNGGINPSNGRNLTQSAATGAKSGYKTAPTPLLFALSLAGYRYTIWLYSTPSHTAGLRSLTGGQYITGATVIPRTTGDQRFRVGYQRADGDTWSDDDAAAVNAALTLNGFTDKTLAIAGAAADAKATGDKIAALGALLVSKGVITQSELNAL